MKKTILMLLFAFTSLYAFSQEIQVVKSNVIYETSGYFKLRDDRNDSESSKYWSFYLTFQNKKYSYATDIKGLSFKTLDELKKFSSLMKQMSESNEVNLKLSSGKYELHKYDFNKNDIYIDADGGYTTLSKDQIVKLDDIIKNLN